jgi:hypothetical protein
MLGRAKKVMIEKENTTIVNRAGKKADIEGCGIGSFLALRRFLRRTGTHFVGNRYRMRPMRRQ